MTLSLIKRLESLEIVLLSRTYGLTPENDAPMTIGEMRQLLLYVSALKAVVTSADELTTMKWPLLFSAEEDGDDEFFEVLDALEVSLEHLYAEG